MSHWRRWSAMSLLLLLSIPRLALAQVASDSREKTEKVGEILTALRSEPGTRIADVGAGEGFYSLRIAQAVAPTGRVTAVDVSEKYLEKLRARIQQDNVTNVYVVVGAVDDPRLSENTFDAVGVSSRQSRCTTTCVMQHGQWRGNPFRTFVHPPSDMMRIIEDAGFRLASRGRTPAWSRDVFVKAR